MLHELHSKYPVLTPGLQTTSKHMTIDTEQTLFPFQSIQDKSGKMLKEVDLLRQKVRDLDGRIGVGAANNLK